MSISLLRYTGLTSVAATSRAFSASAIAFKAAAAAPATATTTATTKATKTPKAKSTTAAATTKKDKAPAKTAAKAAAAPKVPKTPKVPTKPTRKDIAALPKPPKNPPSPYGAFFKDFYAEHKGEYLVGGRYNLADVSRAASVAWSKLSLLESDKYAAAYKAAFAAYVPAYRAYYESLSLADRKAIEAATGKKVKPPGGKTAARKAFRELPGNPGRASSSFFEYLREIKPQLLVEGEREGLGGHPLNIYVAQQAGQRWQALSELDKAKYKKAYEEKKAIFDAWYATQKQNK